MNPLFDHPGHRMLRSILREQEEICEWGAAAAAAVARRDDRSAPSASARTGGILGDDAPAPAPAAARWDGSAYAIDPVPRRDERFTDVFNATALIDDYYADDAVAPDERALALAYKRLREMDVPEWMGPIVFAAAGKPWGYHRELGRQLWDETRHAMMGETALVAAGVPFYDYPIDMAASASLNTEFTPLEAHLLLWHIEQGLMPGATGKRFEWVVAQLGGDAFFTSLQDYDWADEVLHAQIGRRWLAGDFGTPAQRTAAAEAAWERWMETLERYAATSSQATWWPQFVERARAGRAAASAAGYPASAVSPP